MTLFSLINGYQPYRGVYCLLLQDMSESGWDMDRLYRKGKEQRDWPVRARICEDKIEPCLCSDWPVLCSLQSDPSNIPVQILTHLLPSLMQVQSVHNLSLI
jgi:hypothetical protein